MINKLNRIIRDATSVIRDIQEAPEKKAIIELIKALQPIESYYKEWCEEHDEEDGVAEGTTYLEGTFMEFYIESGWWHEVSMQLRKLKI